MASIIIPSSWQGKEADTTSSDAYQSRRQFVRKLGLGTIALSMEPSILGCAPDQKPQTATQIVGSSVRGRRGPLDTIPEDAPRVGYPAARNKTFTVDERPATQRLAASSYNNYYEFISQGDLKNVWPLTEDYDPFPMTIEVKGLVEKSFRLDVSDLIQEMDLEERIYRFRCVEAWSMTIPWTGFPLRKLIDRCKPLSKATFVQFKSVQRPKQMPGIPAAPWLPWPYYEGLRMDEATNDLAFVATGMYGEPLPKQNGSPLRLALPWKYGYKGPKSIVEIRFVAKKPKTYWNDLYPKEYGFLSNVNPNIPHPRWTQSRERFISSVSEQQERPTQLFNGYADFVGSLYPDEPTVLTHIVR